MLEVKSWCHSFFPSGRAPLEPPLCIATHQIGARLLCGSLAVPGALCVFSKLIGVVRGYDQRESSRLANLEVGRAFAAWLSCEWITHLDKLSLSPRDPILAFSPGDSHQFSTALGFMGSGTFECLAARKRRGQCG